MRRALVGTVVAASVSLSSFSAHASDPCETVLCMFGLVQGQESSECKNDIDSYFGIVEMHHGHPDIGATAQSRLSFTQQCKSASSGSISSIDNTFGGVIR
jgi:hypothetical protein